MVRILYRLSFALLLLTVFSCGRLSPDMPAEEAVPTGSLSVTVGTKALDDMAFASGRVQLVRDGVLYAMKTFTGSSFSFGNIPVGTYDLYICGNRSPWFSNLSEMLTYNIWYDSDDFCDGSTMILQAHVQATVTENGDTRVDAVLSHLCAKTHVGNIATAWTRCHPESFRIIGLWIQNVPKIRPIWDWTPSTAMNWWDFFNYWTSGQPDDIYNGGMCSLTYPNPQSLAPGASLAVGKDFYVYPNASEDYPTRLVIKAEITLNGSTFTTYYPIRLDTVEDGLCSFNTIYIHGQGTGRPEGEFEPADVSFVVEDLDYGSGPDIDIDL